ncbi:MAG: hypothetical protein E3J78_04050, partial [Candidatus Cloacimonadota bacterium]
MGEIKTLVPLERYIIFSHETHRKRKAECKACHLVNDTLEVELPEMEVCLDCHNYIETGKECNSCHGTFLEEGLIPESHEVAWLRLHKIQARVDQNRCEMCHEQSFCQECHQGDIETTPSHRRDFIFEHSISALKNENDCRSCHEIETFCLECHREQMIMPIS